MTRKTEKLYQELNKLNDLIIGIEENLKINPDDQDVKNDLQLFKQRKDELQTNIVLEKNKGLLNLFNKYDRGELSEDDIKIGQDSELGKLVFNEKLKVIKEQAKGRLVVNLPDSDKDLAKGYDEILDDIKQNGISPSAEKYVIALNDLADSYKVDNDIDIVIEIQKISLGLIEEFYNQKPLEWLKRYRKNLKSLAHLYYKNNQLDQAIMLEKKRLEILEEYSKGYPKELYLEKKVKGLDTLIMLYRQNNQIEEVNELAIELLKKINHG